MRRAMGNGCTLCLLATLVACSGHEGGTIEVADAPSRATAAAVVQIKGREYLRADLFTADELKRMANEGRADLPPSSPEVLAAQLRAHVLKHGVYYIEREPDLELARRIIRGEARDTTPGVPESGRTIINGDDRALSAGTGYPNSTFGFSEIACSALK
jgi:hypothetical protein